MVAVPSDLQAEQRVARSSAREPAPRQAASVAPPAATARLARIGYALAGIAVAAGWFATRGRELLDPDGAGYWLGVAGASAMAVLLLYPLRKRVRLMRRLGPTRYWFRLHMTLGVLGPILILYHSNFALGSVNSNVALACTLLVAASGLVGRYLHAKVYVDLDGHRRSLRELAEQARLTGAERSRAAALVPELLERMTAFDRAVLTPPQSLVGALLLPPKLAVWTRWEGLRLGRLVRRTLRAQARKSKVVAAERRRLDAVMRRFVREHLQRVRRVAELTSYERLFALWHVFHLPFFYMLVITALIHVVAVHMY